MSKVWCSLLSSPKGFWQLIPKSKGCLLKLVVCSLFIQSMDIFKLGLGGSDLASRFVVKGVAMWVFESELNLGSVGLIPFSKLNSLSSQRVEFKVFHIQNITEMWLGWRKGGKSTDVWVHISFLYSTLGKLLNLSEHLFLSS